MPFLLAWIVAWIVLTAIIMAVIYADRSGQPGGRAMNGALVIIAAAALLRACARLARPRAART